MKDTISFRHTGEVIELHRNQWNDTAYISNYPGLLEEVLKHTWTSTKGKHSSHKEKHAYLKCSSLNGISLHRFVLNFLYSKDKIDEMLGKSNIIEHLDNNGLNCTFENLHILSDDLNKAKAFSIDKLNEKNKKGELTLVPALITDVYYSHSKKMFQLQIFFNKSIVQEVETNQIVEEFIFQYSDFNNLFIDWLYCYECIKKEEFDVSKIHTDVSYVRFATHIELSEEEKGALFVKRDGKYLMVLRTDSKSGPISYMEHIPYKELNNRDSESEEKSNDSQ